MRRPTGIIKDLQWAANDSLSQCPGLDGRQCKHLLDYIAYLEDALECAEASCLKKTQMLNRRIFPFAPGNVFPEKPRKMST